MYVLVEVNVRVLEKMVNDGETIMGKRVLSAIIQAENDAFVTARVKQVANVVNPLVSTFY